VGGGGADIESGIRKEAEQNTDLEIHTEQEDIEASTASKPTHPVHRIKASLGARPGSAKNIQAYCTSGFSS
jgi:hypothetical protein